MELNRPGGFSVCSQEASDGYKESQAHTGYPGAWLDFLTHGDPPPPAPGHLPRSQEPGGLSDPERPRCQAQACGLGPAVGSLGGYPGHDHPLVCTDRW